MGTEEPLLDAQAGREVLAALGIIDKKGSLAAALFEDLEFTLARLKNLFPGSARQHAASLTRVIKYSEKLRATMEAITPPAAAELILSFSQDERSSLIDSLKCLEEACSTSSKQFRADGRINLIENRWPRTLLVLNLMPVFDRYYQDRRKLRGESKDDHLSNFLIACFRSLGIKKIPGADRMKSDYIRSARASRRRHANTMKRIVSEVPRLR